MDSRTSEFSSRCQPQPRCKDELAWAWGLASWLLLPALGIVGMWVVRLAVTGVGEERARGGLCGRGWLC